MKIAILDANTLGEGVTLKPIEDIGICDIYQSTMPSEVEDRIKDSDVVIVNKVKLNEQNLKDADNLKLICLFATGYDNVDVSYCQKRGIAVCNVEGYSTHSVSLVTISMVLSLACHLKEYNDFVRDASYTQSGVANRLTPMYRELCGKTWGIVGYGNIGRQVGEVAKALGCNVIVYKRTPCEECDVVDIDVTVDVVEFLLVSVGNVDLLINDVIHTCQGNHHTHKHTREAHQRHQGAKNHRRVGGEL